MTLEEIEDGLPWGLHDAYLERIEIDWLAQRAVLQVRLMMSEHQDLDQRAEVVVEGLVYCSIDPPEIDPSRGYEPTPAAGLWLDSGAGLSPYASDHPRVPAGCFVHWLFVQDWNRFIHICGQSARLEWIEPTPAPARAGTRALFPGDTIDLSEDA